LLKEKGFDVDTKFENPEDLPFCSQIIGVNWDKCLDEKTPARFFRSIASYNISSNINEIQNEIFHWGPVVSAMKIYTNFLEKYDGLSIYMGPEKTDTIEGGHAVKIVGWGVENGIQFWWIANSWGVEWGKLGYFRMKMNIAECELEQNIVSFIPDIPSFNISNIDYTIIDTELNKSERLWFNVDNHTGYKYSAIENMKDNCDKCNIETLFDIDLLPDYSKFYAGNINTHPKTLLYFSLQNEITTADEYYIFLFLLIVPIILVWYLKRF
jgi:hypothetical protein